MSILYKYRSLPENRAVHLKDRPLQRVLEILEKKQMHASTFKVLNDPMEGFYSYTPGVLSAEDVAKIYVRKNQYRLLSLSKTYDNLLMWSYYADGLRGIVIGVSVADAEPVDYVDWTSLAIDRNDQDSASDIARKILTKKLKVWEHEKEYRVFSHEEDVKVEVQEIIFGEGIDPDKKRSIEASAHKFLPGITPRTMKLADLATGRGPTDFTDD